MNDALQGISTLILASASPRRRELLAEAGFRFEIAEPNISESASPTLSMRELATLNATRKGRQIGRQRPEAVVLAADTLVGLDGVVLGKPADLREASSFLQRLRGRTHQVCTAVFLCCLAARRSNSFCVFSQVRFHSLGDDAIALYLTKVNPLDKAGAYAAQGEGGEIIQEMRGSFTNVVGLPMDEARRALASFGIYPQRQN
jgi:septum formation protein